MYQKYCECDFLNTYIFAYLVFSQLTADRRRLQIKPVRRDFGGDGLTIEERVEAATRALVCDV